MTKRRGILIGLAVVVVYCASLAMSIKGPEPFYKGRTLSEWVLMARPTQADPVYHGFGGVNLYAGPGAEQAEATAQQQEAIERIGTKAIPWLLEWVRYSPAGWQFELERWAQKLARVQPDGFAYSKRRLRLESRALVGFQILATNGEPAVPELTRLARRRNRPGAIKALSYIGKGAVPGLLQVLQDGDKESSLQVMEALSGMESLGTNGRPAVPVLIKCTQQSDTDIARRAALTLGRLSLEADMVIPVLTNYLLRVRGGGERAVAVKPLKDFGEKARPAVPLLKALLGDEDGWVREAATNALRKIAPEALTNASAQ